MPGVSDTLHGLDRADGTNSPLFTLMYRKEGGNIRPLWWYKDSVSLFPGDFKMKEESGSVF